jgi:phosphocarrier protein
MMEVVLTVSNPSGLHARPLSEFIKTARGFKSKITVQNLGRPETKEVSVSAVSLMNIAVRQGHTIRIRADGADEAAALAALQQLVETNFGE